MTNENRAAISSIKSYKIEKEIYKTVIKKLIDKDADENLIALLLNPDLTEKIIDETKYTEALEYLMHTYQQERALIVREMRLKAFEKRVQGPIEEAKVTSVPTQEAIDLNSGVDAEVKNAKDSASTFIDESLDKVKEASTEAEKRRLLTDLVRVLNQANQTTRKGAEEVKASLNDPKFEQAKKASDEFEAKHGLQKADVEAPRVHVVPAPKPVLTEEKKETPKVETPKPVEEPKKEEPKEDEELHEVKATRETSSFFKRHKKGILIATGLGMCALTGVLVPTLIIPALMHANSIVAAHTAGSALASAMHGINTSLGGFIKATFDGATGIWTMANGTAINAAAAKTSILGALGTYGLWSVYGFGLVKSFKNMIKAVDLPSPKKEDEKEKAPLSVRVKQALEDLKGIDEPVIKKEDLKPEEKEEKKETPKVEEVKPVVVEQPKEEAKEEAKTETFELPVAPTKTVTPVVEDVVKQNQRNKVFGEISDEDFLRMIEDLQKQKKALAPTEEATKGMRM